MRLKQRQCRDSRRICPQNARTKADRVNERSVTKPFLFGGRKAALGADQHRPFAFWQPGKRIGRPNPRFVGPEDPPVLVPAVQQPRQRDQPRDLGHEGAAALFCRLDGMGLQAILTDAFGIGEIGLHGQDARRAQLCRFFDNEIGAGLLDRREDQPQVRRIALRRNLRRSRNSSALPC